MKVKIDFPEGFNKSECLSIEVGRIYLGEHIGKITFCPDGEVRLLISKAAVDSGHLIFNERVI